MSGLLTGRCAPASHKDMDTHGAWLRKPRGPTLLAGCTLLLFIDAARMLKTRLASVGYGGERPRWRGACLKPEGRQQGVELCGRGALVDPRQGCVEHSPGHIDSTAANVHITLTCASACLRRNVPQEEHALCCSSLGLAVRTAAFEAEPDPHAQGHTSFLPPPRRLR